MALRAELPGRPVRLRPVHVRRPHRRHARRVWNDACPYAARADHRRLRGQRAPVAAAGERQREHRAEQVLINDWCQQYPSHSIGTVAFGPDGALYVSGGDGASFNVRRLRPGRREPRQPDAGQPVRRPDRRGRRAAQPGPAHDADRRRRWRDLVRAPRCSPTAPVAYWRLGETSGTTAADQYGRAPGTYSAAPTPSGSPAPCPATPTPRSASADPTGYVERPGRREPGLRRRAVHDRALGEAGHARRPPATSSTRARVRTARSSRLRRPAASHFDEGQLADRRRTTTGTTDQAWHHWAIVQGGGSTDVILYKDGANVTEPQQHHDVREQRRPAARDRPPADVDASSSRLARRGRDLQQGADRRPGGRALRGPHGGGAAATERPGDPRRRGAPPRPGDRRGRWPATRTPRPPDLNARRIIAHGFRNPFRFTFRPGTSELWVGDVGWSAWEEINLIANPTARRPERRLAVLRGRRHGSRRTTTSTSAICEGLYAAGTGAVAARTSPTTTTRPSSRARRARRRTARRSPASRSTRAAAIRRASTAACSSPTTPATASGSCPRARTAGPNAGAVSTFVEAAATRSTSPIGPGGDLFYLDFDGGTIHRVTYTSGNQPPTAVAIGEPDQRRGAAGGRVLRAAASTDPEGRPADLCVGLRRQRHRRRDRRRTRASPTRRPGPSSARLRVTDRAACRTRETVTISVDNTPAGADDHEPDRRR